MLKQFIRKLYKPTRSVIVAGHPVNFRRYLRNSGVQIPSHSGPGSAIMNKESSNEKAELEKIEEKLFGAGNDSAVVDKIPVQDGSYKINKPLKMLKYPKHLLRSQDKIVDSAKGATESSPIVKDTKLGLEYTKIKLNDPAIGKLILTAKSRKYRDKSNQIIVEGRRLIIEALEGGCQLQYVLFSQKDQLASIQDKLGRIDATKLIRVPQQDLRVWSTLSTCPGILAIFNRPENDSTFNLQKSSTLPITVICDNIREPNNLGSIIRSCAAIPCAEVIVLKGCCDPWESKALRGGCGGQFRVKIQYGLTWDDLDTQLPENYRFFIAENKTDRANKSEGLSFEAYNDVQVSDSHNVLVIGGETHGISEKAYEFLIERGNEGTCLHIPLAAGVESLNTAAAITLILFEMRKLLLNYKSSI